MEYAMTGLLAIAGLLLIGGVVFLFDDDDNDGAAAPEMPDDEATNGPDDLVGTPGNDLNSLPSGQ